MIIRTLSPINDSSPLCVSVWFSSKLKPQYAYFYFANLYQFTSFLNVYHYSLLNCSINIKECDILPEFYINPYDLL